MAMLMLCRRLQNEEPITVHGFRSSFREWAENQDGYAHRAIEYCLSHSVRNKTEAAYQRDDLVDKRRIIMSDWACFLTLEQSTTVLPFKRVQGFQ